MGVLGPCRDAGARRGGIQVHRRYCQAPGAKATRRGRPTACRAVAPQHGKRVPPMDKKHALALLKKKTGNQPDMESGAALVEALEYMPLAISQAGAYIRQKAPRTPRTPIGKYLEGFHKSEKRKLELFDWDEVVDLRRDRDASSSVMVTWQISFESIRSERPSAADLLSLMSFFDRQGIPESLVRSPDHLSIQDCDAHHSESERNEEDSDIDERSDFGSESNSSSASSASEDSVEQTFDDDLLMLRSYSLISIDETGEVFEMHRLVQLATRRWLSTKERVELFKEQFVSRMARGFPTGAYDNWATCQRLFAHVEGAISHRPKGGESLKEWAQVLYNGSWYAQGQGRYSLAETMAKKSRDARLETLGEKHRLTWDSIEMVGEVLLNQGKYTKAEKLFTKVMEGRKKKLGPAHPDTLTSMANLAATKEKLGPAHPSTLTALNNLAHNWYAQGRAIEAIDMMDSCYRLRVKALGQDHPHTSSSLQSLHTWRAE
ncbi:hypothetical protein Micbo1qcDRAFT_169885 [Microdochium bolleyi]|uniref:DUF7779 domain-containing protein n=1 Tax=Microdochium bolleyi TaxID=196109 RepID=A0A136IJ44_9PEZI|nr:hypothetical protein Micbo1qcDRAFT_169885 [Microdochium bolleyi]